MILSVDPGVATGWVLFTPIDRGHLTIHEWGETVGENEFEAIAWEFNRQQHVSRCVCESFKPWMNRARTWQPASLHIIGALRFIFGTDNVDLRQDPGDVKQYRTKEHEDPYKLPPVGMRSPTGDDHVWMALAHARHWTATKWNGRSTS